jgi:hypothetical protein
MKLLAPESLIDGYKIRLSESFDTPELIYDVSGWQVNSEWMRATDTIRTKVLTLLYESREVLFKMPPPLKILENLFSPWVIINENSNLEIKCVLPDKPTEKDGKAILELTGITLKKSGILPVWNIKSYLENSPVVDFEWNEAPDVESDFREITLIESEVPSENSNITLQLQTDEDYSIRKFAAKERVKEARLKAILSRRAAEVETQRYFNEFNINDSESTFSEYDISDFSENEEEGVETEA